MKKQNTRVLLLGLIVVVIIILTSFRNRSKAQYNPVDHPLKEEVYTILDMKCNGCHRKQNPFMVFKEKNMDKRAAKIYQAVFLDRRMPKDNATTLSSEEYEKLKRWLLTQIKTN